MPIENFEKKTENITQEEINAVWVIKDFMKVHKIVDPIKAYQIVRGFNLNWRAYGLKKPLSEPRLRKMVNYLRTREDYPICSNSKGYFYSEDPEVLNSQQKSIRGRKNALQEVEDGFGRMIAKYTDNGVQLSFSEVTGF